MSKKECIFIIGMHRSGTSAVSKALSDAGLYFGEDLLSADEYNRYGYYEDEKLVGLNDKILSKFKFDWNHPTASVKWDAELLADEILQIENFLAIKFEQQTTVCLKDPRLSLTLEYWIQVCKELNIATKVIFVFRNPVAVAKSIYQRDALPTSMAYRIYLNYVLNAEQKSRNIPRVIFSFEELIANPQQVLQKINKKLELNLDTTQADKSVDETIVHFRPTSKNIKFDLVKEVYESLLDQVSDSQFDALKEKFYDYEKLFGDELQPISAFKSQLFCDTGNGFNEEESIVLKLDTSNRKIKFRIPPSVKKITALRFDPADMPTVIKLLGAYAIGENGQQEKLNVQEHNAVFLPSKHFMFLSFDPILILNAPQFLPKELEVDIEFNLIDQVFIDEYSQMMANYQLLTKETVEDLVRKSQVAPAIKIPSESVNRELVHKSSYIAKDEHKENGAGMHLHSNNGFSVTPQLQQTLDSISALVELQTSIEKNIKTDFSTILVNKNQSLEEWKEKLQAKEGKERQLTTDLERYMEQLGKAKKQVKRLKKQKKNLRSAQKKLKIKFNSLTDTSDLFQQQIQHNTQVHEQSQAELQQKIEENQALNNALLDATNTITKLENQLQQEKEKEHSLNNSLFDATNKINELDQLLVKQKEEEHQETKNVNHEQQLQVVQLQSEVKHLRELYNARNVEMSYLSSSIRFLQQERATPVSKKGIGDYLLMPFAWLWKLIKAIFGSIGLVIGFIWTGLRYPLALLRNINGKNITTLINAIKQEPPSLIVANLKNLLMGRSPVHYDLSSDGAYHQRNIVAQTEVIATPLLKESAELITDEEQLDDLELTSTEDTDVDTVEEEEDDDRPSDIIMYLDRISYEERNVLKVIGWAIAGRGVDRVEILMKGEVVGHATPDIMRPDVNNTFPEYEDSLNSGFVFEGEVAPDEIELIIRVYDKKGKLEEVQEKIIPYQTPRIIDQPKREVYQVWVENNEIKEDIRSFLTNDQLNWEYRPLISIVVPVYNVAEKWLRKAVESIQSQVYDNWELILSDDASTAEHILPLLKELEDSDDRIKVVYNEINQNISAATNAGLEQANGEFIAFMDNDDELAAHALYEIANAINNNSNLDILYSDEDKISEDGKRYDPFFKPDWSPELLLSFNYLNHLLVVRKELVDSVNGLRSAYDGAQDYDFILRIVERSQRVKHIPKVLYHWRAVAGSIAAAGDAKSDNFNFFDKVTGALQDYLYRNQIAGRVYQPEFAIKNGLGLCRVQWEDIGPLVSIIIPSKNHYKTLKKCIDSLRKTTYQNYEVIIADNGSDDAATLKYLNDINGTDGIKIVTIPNKGERFSYSYINNQAVRHAKGELILLLNDDTEVITPNWLSQMVGYLKFSGVGIVGARLMYPDNTIQHAGVLLDLYTGNYDNMPDHVFKHHPADALGYYFFAKSTRNYSCITAACMLISKDLYQKVGGLDEQEFLLAYNDVDLCLKVIEEGYRIVYAAEAELYHYESKSRKQTLEISEVAEFKRKWREYRDPYYNPNLSQTKPFEVSPLSTLNYELLNKKVLIISHNLNFEGAPLQMYEIVEGLLKREPKIQIEIFSPMDGPLKDWYYKLGLFVHVFTDPATKAILRKQPYDLGVKELGEWIAHNNFTAVYANTLMSFYAHHACQPYNIKSIWGIHESSSPEKFFTYLGLELRERAYESFQHAYALVFVAKATQNLFVGYDSKRSSVVINNGLKKNRFERTEIPTAERNAIRQTIGVVPTDILFLNLGTTCARKGQKDFVNAAIINIKKGMTNSKYVLVGVRENDYTNDMLQLIEDQGMGEYFITIKETDKVEEFYLAADVFVCSSYNESYPRVILEAMLFGLPIITTPIFGIVEQVIEHINANFYAPGDIKRLAHFMEELVVNSEQRLRYKRNAPHVYQLINSFDEMVEKYAALI